MEGSKKFRRHQSKLKKAKAFLELVGRSVPSSGRRESDRPAATSESEYSDFNESKTLMELDKTKHEKVQELTTNDLDDGVFIKASNESPEQSKKDLENEVNKSNMDAPPGDYLLEMKKIMRERNKQAMQKPKVFLTLENLAPFQQVSNKESNKDEIFPPLYVMDLQHLLLYALQGNMASFKPRWCKLLRVMKVSSVILLCLDGIGYQEALNDKDNFSWITQSFNTHVEMICPEQYSSSADAELYSVPLSVSQLKKVNQKVPVELKRQIAAKLRLHGTTGEKVSRLCLLLSSDQMKIEGYPMPIMTKEGQYTDFVFSKDHYTQVTSRSPLFALDCEMCLTTAGHNELTRISLLSENGEVVYDSLVKPRNRIINYLTKYSGITKAMIEPVLTTLEDVQRDIKELLPPDAVLCGQSLNSDLIALKMFHPYVIDTSVIYNMSGNRSMKAGLKKLTAFFLSRNIQNSSNGHCSAEDAKATLDLVKLKLNKGLEFGDATISGVYFPSVETYFLGEESGKKAVSQNVEVDSVEDKTVKLSYGQKHHLASAFLADKSAIKTSQALKRGHDSGGTASSGSDSDEKEEGSSKTESLCKKIKISEEDQSTSRVDSAQPDSLVSESKMDTTDHESQSSTKASWIGTQQQTAIFSQKNSVHVSHSFFKLVYDAGRSGSFIGHSSVTSKYLEEPVETITASDDSEVRKCAKSMVQSREFVWANFSEYREAINKGQMTDAAAIQKLRRKLDHRARSVLKKVKENALVVLLLTGRQQGQDIKNAGVFVKTT